MPEQPMSHGWADALSLDHLVPYTHPSAAWSDRHSTIVLTWERPEQTGLQRCEALIGWGGTQLTGQLLDWKIRENGASLPVTLVGRNFRPDQVIEQDAAPGLNLTVTAAYISRNALAVQFDTVLWK